MNPSVIPNGLFVNTQTPLDRKVWVLTLDELKDLGEGNIKAYNYYKGLLVFCVENRKTYIWDNVEDEYNISRVKLLEDDFIYPEGWPDINGIHYAENYYNFFEYNPSDLQGKSFKKIIVDGQAFATQLFDAENEGKFHLFIVNHPSVSNPNPDNLKWQIEDEIFEHNSYIYDYIADELFEDNDSRIDALSYGNDGEIHYWKGVEGGKPTYPNVPENHILKVFFLLSNDGVYTLNPEFTPGNYDLSEFNNQSESPFFNLKNLGTAVQYYKYNGGAAEFEVPNGEFDGHLMSVTADQVPILDYNYDPVQKIVTINNPEIWLMPGANVYITYFKFYNPEE